MNKIQTSNNEWGQLKKVIVGLADFARIPLMDKSLRTVNYSHVKDDADIPKGGLYPIDVIREANEDLDILANTLEQLGVEVLRPHDLNFQAIGGMYNYCPRDRLLIAGNRVIDPVMMYPCRDREVYALDFVVHKAKELMYMPRGADMVMDAANVCRMNDRWLYLESPSGNRKAYDWLVNQLPDIDIELVNFYSGVHIDSTICPLREGFVVLNASRVNQQNCPKAFNGWTKLWVTDCVPQAFHEYPYASKWIAMNMLSIDPNTVIVDRAQCD